MKIKTANGTVHEFSYIQLDEVSYDDKFLTPIQREIVNLYEENKDQYIIKSLRTVVDIFIEQVVDITIDNSDTTTYSKFEEQMSYTSFYRYLNRIYFNTHGLSDLTYDWEYCKENNITPGCRGRGHNLESVNRYLKDICLGKEIPTEYSYGKEPNYKIKKEVIEVSCIVISPKGRIILQDCKDEIEGLQRSRVKYFYNNLSDSPVTLTIIND